MVRANDNRRPRTNRHGGKDVGQKRAARDLMQAKHPYTQGLLNCLPRIGGDRGPLPSLDRDAAWAT